MLSQTERRSLGSAEKGVVNSAVMVSEKFTGEDRDKVNLWEGFQVLV